MGFGSPTGSATDDTTPAKGSAVSSVRHRYDDPRVMQSMWAAGRESGYESGFEDGYNLAMTLVAAEWYRELAAAGTVAA